MTDFSVILAPGAEDDIAQAWAWYHERNVLVAEAFRADVFDAIDRIAATPRCRSADNAGNRTYVLRRFPYSVHYDVVKKTVTVLAVAHHRRRPGYWQAR